MTTGYVRTALWALLFLLWTPTVAFAATVTLQQTFDGVTASVVAIVAALSSLSGATALVVRIDKELRSVPGATLPRPVLFASAHMLGSWLAGALAFIFGESQDMNDWLELALIVLMSFGGAKVIELAIERWLAQALPTKKAEMEA